MKHLLLALALGAMAATVAAQGGGGQGKGGGKGTGEGAQVRQRSGDKDCGRDLVVVKPDGTRQHYASITEFFDAFPPREIDQGESPRRGVRIDDLLRAYGADWVEALDCEDKIVQLPGGMPVRYVEYFVLTGRNTMKGVREVDRGRFINTVHPVRKLTFHGAPAKGAAPAKKP